MKKSTKFEIPIDSRIEEFSFHLKSHPRTILSAKFGDGKSYFLSKFKKKNKNNSIFITLHLINYQVLENRDIFELIKRDVLFQIATEGVLSEDIEVSDEAAFAFYVQNNCMGLVESVLSYISQLHSDPKVAKGILAALATNKFLHSLKEKVLEKKKKYKSTEALEEFFNKASSIPVLEEDLVTKIIQDSIDEYKRKHNRKRIVLLIEDMDRLDPAHLFRIMNVFSAHLDTEGAYFIKANGKYFYNKFHFDNVVFVMDYYNTKKIFEHFYGKDTNFDGYIQKFISKGYFIYSLEEERCKYVQNMAIELTGLPERYIKTLITKEVLADKNIRIIANSFDDIDSQIIKMPVYNKYLVHLGFLKLYIIMTRLGLDENLLVSAFRKVYVDMGDEILSYLIGYLAISFGTGSSEFYCKGIKEIDKLYKISLGSYNKEQKLFVNSRIVHSDKANIEPLNNFDEWPKNLDNFAAK